LTSKDVQINIIEIRRPEIDAAVVAESIAKQLEARINYRRASKMSIQAAMRGGAQGIKIRVSGRLNGAEMARSEEFKQGRTPLHTFRADIDYSLKEALTVYGKIGVKVWICKGEILGKPDLSPNAGANNDKGGGRGGDRRRGGGGRGGDRRGGGAGGGRGGDRRGGGGGRGNDNR
jgi:small subunit ribosomal protein S3